MDKFKQLNITAVTNPATVGSVKWKLNGPVSVAPVDNTLPYALFGDDRGNYKGGALPVGSYTLTAIPFSEAKRSGVEGESKTIHFTIIDEQQEPSPTTLAVQTVSLINAQTNQSVATLKEGMVLALADVSSFHCNVLATTTADVRSLHMQLSGAVSQTATESQQPLCLVWR